MTHKIHLLESIKCSNVGNAELIKSKIISYMRMRMKEKNSNKRMKNFLRIMIHAVQTSLIKMECGIFIKQMGKSIKLELKN